MDNSILRLPVVQSKTGLSRSSIYLKVSQGIFPKPISLGVRAVGWVSNEVEDWLSQQIQKSRSNEEVA